MWVGFQMYQNILFCILCLYCIEKSAMSSTSITCTAELPSLALGMALIIILGQPEYVTRGGVDKGFFQLPNSISLLASRERILATPIWEDALVFFNQAAETQFSTDTVNCLKQLQLFFDLLAMDINFNASCFDEKGTGTMT